MPTISHALGPAQLGGLTSTAPAEMGASAATTPSAGSMMPNRRRRGFTLTTVYRPAPGSSVKEPPPAAGFPLAVPLLRGPAGVVHGVVPEGQRQKERADEHQQGQ